MESVPTNRKDPKILSEIIYPAKDGGNNHETLGKLDAKASERTGEIVTGQANILSGYFMPKLLNGGDYYGNLQN